MAGCDPWTGGNPFRQRIAFVLGNKQQLLWDLPPEETFRLNRAIYGVANADYVKRRAELVELLVLGDLIDKPARQLSLGERMKCELAAALLHQPEVLFLDEPTLGLDLEAQQTIRTFLGEYRQRHGATILLTSHYMADVTALASRVLIINRGRLLYDGELSELVARIAPIKRIELVLSVPVPRATLEAVWHRRALCAAARHARSTARDRDRSEHAPAQRARCGGPVDSGSAHRGSHSHRVR